MKTDNTDTRLSHSSASLLLGCEERYVHYKVKGTPHDPDYEEDMSHFAIGKAFHYVLETTMHSHPKDVGMRMSEILDYCVQNEDIGLDEDSKALVHGMVLRYLEHSGENYMGVAACEFSIESKEVVGYIDAIAIKRDESWWILDLKTAATISPLTVASLSRNRQLNLYAHFAPQFASQFKLDPEKFGGVVYAVTTKSRATRRETESYSEFVMRIKSLTRTEFFWVDKKDMDIQATYERHIELYKRSLKLRSGKAKPTRNYDYCNAFYRACPYFSHCHGETLTKRRKEHGV